jgi:hypothetical protein
MTAFYELLADALVTIHLAYMAYVVLGQLAILVGWALAWKWVRNPWFRISHLAMILIVAVEAVVGFECPLTTWENYLRIDVLKQVKVNPDDPFDWDVEDASFIAKLLRKVMFPEADFVPYLKPAYYTFAAVVLASLFLVPPRFRRGVAESPRAQPRPEEPTESGDVTARTPVPPAY